MPKPKAKEAPPVQIKLSRHTAAVMVRQTEELNQLKKEPLIQQFFAKIDANQVLAGVIVTDAGYTEADFKDGFLLKPIDGEIYMVPVRPKEQ